MGHCPRCCINGIRYLPWLSLTPMRMGSPLHVMSTSSSLNTLTPSFVNTDTVPSSAILPTLIREVGKSWNVSARIAWAENCQNGRWVTYVALLVPPLATPTFCVDCCRMLGLRCIDPSRWCSVHQRQSHMLPWCVARCLCIDIPRCVWQNWCVCSHWISLSSDWMLIPNCRRHCGHVGQNQWLLCHAWCEQRWLPNFSYCCCRLWPRWYVRPLRG